MIRAAALVSVELTAACIAAAPTMTGIIDAGHGGRDRGTNRKSIYESQVTLKVAQYLHEILRKDKSFKAVLSRENEHGVSLSERARIAKNQRGDLLVSIHVNSS